MQSWGWALLLKPLLFVLFVAAYYFGIIVPLRWVRRRYPNNRVIHFLFRERGRYDTTAPDGAKPLTDARAQKAR